jgi:hypothetical protein
VGEPPTVMDCASCYWRCELGSAMGGSLARCVVSPPHESVKPGRPIVQAALQVTAATCPARQVQLVTSSSAVPPTRPARPTGTRLSHPEHPCSGARGVAPSSLDRGIPLDQDRLACPPESADCTASTLHHEWRSGSSVGAAPKTVGTEVCCRCQAASSSGSQDRADTTAPLGACPRA